MQQEKDYEPVYIYALIDPRDDKIRYIGKSIDPDQRYIQHLNDKKSNKAKVGWINRMANRGYEPTLKVLEVANERNWEERERWWIERGREFGWKLFNISPGGGGSGLYQLPSSLYDVLDSKTMERLEKLPNKRQADIVIAAAEAISDYFVEMVERFVAEDYDGYNRCREVSTEIVVGFIANNLN